MEQETLLGDESLLASNLSTTTVVYQTFRLSPQWLLALLNCIAGIALAINFAHIVLMANMRVGMWTAAKNFKIFVIYLAVTDLILSGGRLSLNNAHVQKYMFENRWLCIVSPTVIHSINVYQTNLLSLASLERFIAVCTGVNYSTNFFVKHYPKILGLFMALWVVIYIIIAILFHKVGYSTQGVGACRLGSTRIQSLDLISGLAALLNLIVLVVFYGMLLCKSKMMSMQLAKRNSQRPAVSRRSAQLNRTVGGLVATKVILWIPTILALILRTVGLNFRELGQIGSISIYLCSIANPILYGLTSSKYRKFLRSTLHCRQSTTVGSSTQGATSYSKGTVPKENNKINVSTVITQDSSTSSSQCEMDLVEN